MDVRRVDPTDEAAFDGWYAVLEAAVEHDRPGEPDWLRHEQQASAVAGLAPDAPTARVLLSVVDGTRTVAAAGVDLPMRDNLHFAEFDLAVHPQARRRGAGAALEAAVVELARGHGRTTLLCYVDEPPGCDGRSAGRSFGLEQGYAVAQQEVRRDLDVPLEPATVAALQDACAGPATGYDLRVWWDRVPEELVEDRAELSRSMSVDVPLDAVDFREEVWDAERIRDGERRALDMDRRTVSAGVVHAATGRLVGYSTVGIPNALPQRAYQWDTIVLRAHRGHRLGTVLKLAVARAVAAGSPQTRYVSTWNAAENTHMIAVNDSLGARVNGTLAAMQRVLT